MRRLIPVLVVLVLLVASSGTVRAFSLSSDRATVLSGINAARAQAGLKPVAESAALDATAQWRSTDMLEDKCFSHVICDTTDDYVFPHITIPFTFAGEVIAWNTYPDTLSAASAVQQWMLSPGHRAILLGKYTFVGIGVAFDPATSKRMFTALFVQPPLPPFLGPPVPKATPKPKPVVHPSVTMPPTDTSG